jgi:hypothetical protein
MKDCAQHYPERYLAAAGILAHYVGDACQPLHATWMSDGIPDEQPDIPRPGEHKDRVTHQSPPAIRGEGVHGAYETDMLNWATANSRNLLFPCTRTRTSCARRRWMRSKESQGAGGGLNPSSLAGDWEELRY